MDPEKLRVAIEALVAGTLRHHVAGRLLEQPAIAAALGEDVAARLKTEMNERLAVCEQEGRQAIGDLEEAVSLWFGPTGRTVIDWLTGREHPAKDDGGNEK